MGRKTIQSYPIVTYSQIEPTYPPCEAIIYEPVTYTNPAIAEQPKEAQVQAVLSDCEDQDSINAENIDFRSADLSDRYSSPDRFSSASDPDWNSNSGESSSGIYVDGSLSGSRSPSPQKSEFIYECNQCQSVKIH